MRCPNCGGETSGKFCTSCGAELARGTAAVAATSSESSPTTDPAATSVISRADSVAHASSTVPRPTAPSHSHPLPPLTTGQIFNDSFALYRKNLPLLAGTTAVLAIAQLVLTLLV